jgi:hypothetical protein
MVWEGEGIGSLNAAADAGLAALLKRVGIATPEDLPAYYSLRFSRFALGRLMVGGKRFCTICSVKKRYGAIWK